MEESNLPKSKTNNLVNILHENCNIQALAAMYDKEINVQNLNKILIVCIVLPSLSHRFPAMFSLALQSQYALLVACRQ